MPDESTVDLELARIEARAELLKDPRMVLHDLFCPTCPNRSGTEQYLALLGWDIWGFLQELVRRGQ